MAIQNDNTVLRKGDLKAYHQEILPYLGGNIMMSTGASDYYSDEERIVGVWFGKPLYQKTINLQLPTITTDGQSTAITIPFSDSRVNISNPETGWIASGFGYTNDGTLLPIMNVNSAWGNSYQTAQYFVYAAFHMVQMGIMLQANRLSNSEAPISLTIQYTKTTDAANSAPTVAGCYDINRPDLWKENTEIYFGNGLYGRRCTGTFNAVNSTTLVTLVSNIGSINIKNVGGMLKRSIVGWYDFSVPFYYEGMSASICVNSDGHLTLCEKDSGSINNLPYDVWVTYTK